MTETPSNDRLALATAIVPAVPAVVLLARFVFAAGEALSLLILIVMIVAMFSYVAWIVIAVPVIMLIRHTPLYHPVPIIMAGGICGLLVGPIGRLAFDWYRPPEIETWWAVASGIIAALLFVWIVRVPFRRPVKLPVRDATNKQ